MTLKISNLSKKIQHKIILNDISFTVNSGEIAILLGRSGAGKSTILRILNQLEDKDSGTILFQNTPLLDNHNNLIGMVFQQFNLFSHLTALQNITLALTQTKQKTNREATAIALALLTKYNLLEKKDSNSNTLSGGEKQRLAIARTVAIEPKIICFDEPISALDPYSTQEIINCLIELKKQNYIIIMTTHNVSILSQLPGTIHLIETGKIIESVHTNVYYKNPEHYQYIHNFIHAK